MAAGLPTAVVVEIEFAAGVWTDVSTSVVGDSIEIVQGKDSPAGDIQPGTLDLVLDNSDGTWTPDNAPSTYYPNVVEGKRIRVKVTKGSTSPRFVGRIVLWEPDFPDVPQQSQTRVSAIDALGDMARKTLPTELLPVLANEYRNGGDLPPQQTFFHWPLHGGDRLVESLTGYYSLQYYQPTTGGEVSWDADSTFPLGGDACLSLTAGVGLQLTLSTVGGWFSPALGGVGAAFRLAAGTAGLVLVAGDRRPASAGLNAYAVWWDGVRTLSFREYVAGTATTYGSVTADPGWHVVEIDDTHIVVDGVSTSVAPTGSPGTFESGTLPVIVVGGTIDLSVRDLHITNAQTMAAYLVDTGASLATITSQVAVQCAASSLNASLAWTTSPTGVKATPPATAGRAAIDVIGDLANSQAGIAYVAYTTASSTQPITLLANVDSRSATVALTVDAEVDLDGGPTLDRNVYDKVATATASNAYASITVSDASLVSTYGSSTGDKQTVLSNLNALGAAASDLIGQTKNSKLRLSEVTIDLATAGTDLYAAWFALRQGQRVRVSNLPSAYFGVTQMDGYVLGWRERPSLTGYKVTLKLQPADAPSEAKYDDATRGRYGWADGAATVTSGTAVGTTANGTLVITTPSGPCLTTNAAMYPMDLDWNGESVTITSAPASSTSPQTVTTTTRGANGTTARSHSTGEAINVWLTARYAL